MKVMPGGESHRLLSQRAKRMTKKTVSVIRRVTAFVCCLAASFAARGADVNARNEGGRTALGVVPPMKGEM